MTYVQEEKWKNELLERQVSMYENQFALIRESQNKLRIFRHDMKHHFIMMSEYLKNGHEDELKEYLGQEMECIGVEREYAKSGNEDVDCILNYMIERASSLGTEVTVEVKVPQEKFMPSLDLNILLGNLLENAVEALAQAENRQLNIYMKLEKGMLYLSIYNTYQSVKMQDGEYLSRKRDGKKKGIGIESCRRVAEKYGGKISMECEEKLFKIEVILFVKLMKSVYNTDRYI